MRSRTAVALMARVVLWIAAVAGALTGTGFAGSPPATAHPAAAASIALRGIVSAAAGDPMEGVIVIAQRAGDAVLTAVSTDESGRFEFPRDHLRPGRYALTIRATGFALQRPGERAEVAIGATAPATLTLSLRPITDRSRLALQLTNLEWVNSFPGSDAEKDALMRNIVNCGFCHSLLRIAQSNHTAQEFRSVIQRMATYESDHSSGITMQISAPPAALDTLEWWGRDAKPMADYLASVNLRPGQSTWAYAFKTLPRPRGKATRAIVTVYPLPRGPSVIHDLDVDSKGNVWYGNTSADYIGRLNPASGEFSAWPAPNFLPPAAPGLERITGVQDIQVDPDDRVWAAVGGTRIAVFAPNTAKWQTFDVPVLWLNPFRSPLRRGQRTLWVTGIASPPTAGHFPEAAFRLDLDSGVVSAGIPLYDDKPPPQDPGHARPFRYCYMMDQDTAGNFLCTEPVGSNIVRAAFPNGPARLIATPTPHAYPRRGYRDDQNRFWFSEFFADKIGVIDLATDEIKEYDTGTKYLSPYFARPDTHGNVWASSNGSDRLLRLDPLTGTITQYLMPVYYDARKVVVDTRAARTTVWLPNKNSGQLIRVEVPD